MRKGGEFLAMLVYVDDVIVTGSSPDMINNLKIFLDNYKGFGFCKVFPWCGDCS